jgi:DNA-directed RNA polymerase specialized sigma24 family protein
MMPTLRNDKCTKNDYRRLFAASAEPLRWLCCTLTGDEELSGKILDAALEQSLKGADQVFREWMLSWARRLIIKVCIETMRSRMSNLSQAVYPLSPMRLDLVDRDHLSVALNLPADLLQQRLLELDVTSRFVFVLRALDGYSRRETSLLLNIDDRACEWIYVRAASVLEADAERLAIPDNPGFVNDAECYLAQAGD